MTSISRTIPRSLHLARVLGLALLLGACQRTPAPPLPDTVERVDISFSYMGWGNFTDTLVILRANNGQYWMAGQYTVNLMADTPVVKVSHPVPASRVARLLEEMRSPALSRDAGLAELQGQLHAVGMEQQVRATAEGLGLRWAIARRDERAALGQWLGRYYESPIRWTDDYPSISVRVRTAHETLSVRSDSQLGMMLPWQDARGERWNPRMSQVLTTLLPAESMAAGRIAQRCLATQLTAVAYPRVVAGPPSSGDLMVLPP